MLEQIHFAAGKVCEVNGVSFGPLGDFRSCLQAAGALPVMVEILLDDLVISPVATEYVQLFRSFLWDTCAPALSIICGSIATIKILQKIFSGVV